MAFKGENLAGKGKLYPVFIKDDGTMYSVRMSEEQLEIFQLTVRAVMGGEILLDPEPLNNCCSYRIEDKRKTK